MKCKNCGYVGEAKKGKGLSWNLCPKCLFNKLEDDGSETIKKESDIVIGVGGDGSSGIEGNISIKDKDSAIMFITGIMEQFDIGTDDLEY